MAQFKIATIDDLNKLLDFYNLIIYQQQFDEYHPMWTKDIYPSKDDIKNHILNNKFYYLQENNEIVCALAFMLSEEEMYKKAKWTIKEDVAVIHLLAVNPKYRKLGNGQKIIYYVLEDNKGLYKTIHLDVMLTNLSAKKLYEKLGFRFVERLEVYYEDTGKCQADLFELIV